MKTIQELNAKWYWRLIKVLSIIICLGVCIYLVMLSYSHYSNEFNARDKYGIASLLKTKEESLGGSSLVSIRGNSNAEELIYIGKKILPTSAIIIAIVSILLLSSRAIIYYIILGKFNPEK